ncbi:MAG: peptidoglycan recognition family protein [Nannocystaceae bacterium]
MSNEARLRYNQAQHFAAEEIKHIQSVIGVPVDGVWNIESVEALIAWQEREGIRGDGKIWRSDQGDTWSRLLANNLDDDADELVLGPVEPPGILETLRHAGVAAQDERVNGRPRSFTPVGIILHHTASARRPTELNGIRIMKEGRRNLPGPLCQIYVGRLGGVVVVTEGLANHAGKGRGAVLASTRASKTVCATGGDTTGGNRWFIGIEVENDGRDEPYGEATLRMIETISAALLNAHGWSQEVVIGHREWTRRKIDPVYDMNEMRARIGARANALRNLAIA